MRDWERAAAAAPAARGQAPAASASRVCVTFIHTRIDVLPYMLGTRLESGGGGGRSPVSRDSRLPRAHARVSALSLGTVGVAAWVAGRSAGRHVFVARATTLFGPRPRSARRRVLSLRPRVLRGRFWWYGAQGGSDECGTRTRAMHSACMRRLAPRQAWTQERKLTLGVQLSSDVLLRPRTRQQRRLPSVHRTYSLDTTTALSQLMLSDYEVPRACPQAK